MSILKINSLFIQNPKNINPMNLKSLFNCQENLNSYACKVRGPETMQALRIASMERFINSAYGCHNGVHFSKGNQCNSKCTIFG